MASTDWQRSMRDVVQKGIHGVLKVCAGKYEIKAIKNLKYTEKTM